MKEEEIPELNKRGEFTFEQMHLLRCMREWLEIRSREAEQNPSKAIHTSASQLDEDIAHSSLLRRLLAGKRPLPQPPPTFFSQPAYKLLDEGMDDRCDVTVQEEGGQLYINQSGWKIVEKKGVDDYVVEGRGGLMCHCYKKAEPDSSAARQPAFNWTIEVVGYPH